MSVDAVREAQKQLQKQRKKERRIKHATSTNVSAAADRGDVREGSEAASEGLKKRKSKAESDTRPQKKQRVQVQEPGGATTSIADASKERPKSEKKHRKRNEAIAAAKTQNTEDIQELAHAAGPQHRFAKKGKTRLHDWVLSQSVGGRFLPIDPIFSHDEKHLILATRNAVLVYSAESSLLYRRIDRQQWGAITCLALSPSDPSRLYIGTSSGHLLHIDWYNGNIVKTERTGSSVTSLVACVGGDANGDTLYILETTEGGNGKHGSKLCRRTAASMVGDSKVLLKVSKPLRAFEVVAEGRVVIAASEGHVFLGLISNGGEAHSIWHQVESTDPIVSICAKQRLPTSSPGKSASRGSGRAPSIDLAVGTVRGVIYVYEDLITKLTGSASGQRGINSAVSPTSRKLHWHRGPVSAVKWSLDGNYLISGGSETVLQLWQMKTGKAQSLPHLTSAIDFLTVSPTGASYAVQLGDNSIMVLSTAELQPTTHISGIQSRINSQSDTVPQLRTVAAEQAKDSDDVGHSSTVIAAVHPKLSNRLLLAVPASQPKTDPPRLLRAAPFMQTYDLSSGHNVSRQALTRNNATHFMNGPESNLVGEPNTAHLQISHDGTWLATVEEWLPPRSDLDYASVGKDGATKQRTLRLEVYLKFWKWVDEAQIWTLDTRIDAPHSFPDGITPARVQCLRADPTRNEFATTGEDGIVRVWRAKTRYRDAIVVRGESGAALSVWSCRAAIELTGPVIDIEDGFATEYRSVISRVAHSADGSVIVACSEDAYGPTSGVLRFIDTASGTVKQSRPDLFVSGLKDVGIIDRYLVVLSDSLLVYNMVKDELSYQHDFDTDGALLALNNTSGTFAITLSTKKTRRCRVVVFDPKSPVPVYDSPKLDLITAILSLPHAAGYILLNDRAEARTLSLSTSVSVPLLSDTAINGQAAMEGMEALPAPEPVSAAEAIGEDVEMADANQPAGEEEDDEDDEDESDGKKVVRPQQLAALFEDRPSFAMPPVRDMFDTIVGLYGRKSRAVGKKRIPNM